MYVCFGNFYDKIICYYLINALLQVLIYLVVYYFSPEVFAISDIISPFLSLISKVIEGKEKRIAFIIWDSVGYIIIIIASFIYNEIIVCNFCHLNENTWKAIVKKANDDYLGRASNETDTIADDEYDFDLRTRTSRETKNNRTTELSATLTERSSLSVNDS